MYLSRSLYIYYIYFSKTTWNCLFLRSNFFGFTHSFGFLVTLLYIFGKKVIFRNFGNNIGSVIRKTNVVYMVWGIPNIYTPNLLGKFGPKI